eukprot:CAMPEP_0194364462 /NCGR_PEP_ID=MMETSP0174-20130528/12387_1 /TAXON_ID=216777 /ORGANISM="Proboscia alata, Strain PI-D3" /LENGTH=201 /DNA_ID=CAMNT_0039138509 /DNA_START=54 /DNA_END=659 /DNA_ORIENTATION=-
MLTSTASVAIMLLLIAIAVFESTAFQNRQKFGSIQRDLSSSNLFLTAATSSRFSTTFPRNTALNLSEDPPSNQPEEYSDFEDQSIGSSSSSNANDDNIQYEKNIDWDAEWSKVVKGEGQPSKRKKDTAKSDVELAAIKARKEMELKMKVAKAQAQSASASFSPGNLTGDWRVWIGIIAVISVASALIGGADSGYSNESFLI